MVRKILFYLVSFLGLTFCPLPSFGLVGDGGTIAACYPGGFTQVLLGVKPFVVPCAQFTTAGMCYHRGKPYGAMAVFWLPTYAIEITGQANTTVFPKSLADIVNPGLSTSGGSMVQGEVGNDTQTKYREAHIYELSTTDVATILAGNPAMTCMLTAASSITGSTVFKSEEYPGWRLGKDPTGANPLASKAGSWGPLYPRSGWSNNPSNITNSLLLSYRAQQLGAEFSLIRGGTLYVDKYEIGGPNPGACYPLGNPAEPMLQEMNANRLFCADRIVTIYWRLVTTCCNFGTF